MKVEDEAEQEEVTEEDEDEMLEEDEEEMLEEEEEEKEDHLYIVTIV